MLFQSLVFLEGWDYVWLLGTVLTNERVKVYIVSNVQGRLLWDIGGCSFLFVNCFECR